MQALALPLIVGFVVLVVVLVVVVVRSEKKRRQEVEATALSMGLQFAADVPDLVNVAPTFEVFSRGESREAHNVLSGQRSGLDVWLADYSYVTGSGRDRRPHLQTVCILKGREVELPHSFLRHEVRIVDTIREKLGGQDIDFDDDPGFSRAFVLQGQDPEGARRLYGPAARVHVLRFAGKSIELETKGDTLVMHRCELVRSDALLEFLEEAVQTLAVLRDSA